MKVYVALFCCLVLFIGLTSTAWCGNYRGSSGTEYQYDLNNPQDQNSYIYDYDAQRRDQMNTNPGVNTDKDNGQYGGGVY